MGRVEHREGWSISGWSTGRVRGAYIGRDGALRGYRVEHWSAWAGGGAWELKYEGALQVWDVIM